MKVDQFALRDQEIEILEEEKQKQRRHNEWKKQQRSKIGRLNKVRVMNIQLVKIMSRPECRRDETNM